jgi:ribosome-binding factor A
MTTTRQSKVNRLLQKELGDIFQKGGSSLVPGSLISVTEVRVSPDLSVARVFLSIYPVKDKAGAMEKINDRKSEIIKALGVRIKTQLRIVPELILVLDDTFDQAAKIEALLGKQKKKEE